MLAKNLCKLQPSLQWDSGTTGFLLGKFTAISGTTAAKISTTRHQLVNVKLVKLEDIVDYHDTLETILLLIFSMVQVFAT